jgi:hypothetical protein
MHFGTLNEFLEIQNGKRNWKTKKKHGAQYWTAIRPMALHRWLGPEGKAASQPMPPVTLRDPARSPRATTMWWHDGHQRPNR